MAERDEEVKEEYEKAKPFSRAGRMRAAGIAMGTMKKQAADRKAQSRKIAQNLESKKNRPGARRGTTQRGLTTSSRNIAGRTTGRPQNRAAQSPDTRRPQGTRSRAQRGPSERRP